MARAIAEVAAHLKELFPDVKFGIGHGQMKEGALQEVMEAFAAGEIDGAFLESYLAAVTMDRWNTRPVAGVRCLDRRTSCQGLLHRMQQD